MSSVSNFKINGVENSPVVEIGKPFTVTATVSNTGDSAITAINLNLFLHTSATETVRYGRVTGLNIPKGGTGTITVECVIPENMRSTITKYYGSDRVISAMRTKIAFYYGSTMSMALTGTLLPSTGFSLVMIDYRPEIFELQAWRYTESESIPDDEGVKIAIMYGLRARSDSYYAGFSISGTISDGTTTRALTLSKPTNGGTFTVSAPTAYQYSNGTDWTVTLTMTDGYQTVERSVTVPRAFANLHLSGAMTDGKQVGGVCFGGFSSVKDGDAQGKFECYFPAYFYGGIVVGGMKLRSGIIEGVSIASGTCKNYDVVFDEPFEEGVVPIVMCTLLSGSTAGNHGRVSCGVATSPARTNEGFQCRVWNGDSSSRIPNVMWLAFAP